MHFKIAIAAFVIFSLYACNARNATIVGVYKAVRKVDNGAELTLFQDSTYVYNQQSGQVFFFGKGNWTFYNDTLKLTSTDTTLSAGTPVQSQIFKVRSNKLREVVNGKVVGPGLKRKVVGS